VLAGGYGLLVLSVLVLVHGVPEFPGEVVDGAEFADPGLVFF
jgi:hypothetical protein